MKNENRICINCNKTFSALLKEIKRGGGKFCSRKCFGEYRSKTRIPLTPNVICQTCGKLFYKNNSDKKNSKHGKFFCSRSCKDKGQRIDGVKEIHPGHYKDGSYSLYRKAALDVHGKVCSSCGYDKVPEVLEVHHEDRDRTNNSLSNLIVLCPTCHQEAHFLNKDGRFCKRK